MKIFTIILIISLYYLNSPVNCVGLKEEFTWSRISFLTTESRFYRPQEATYSSQKLSDGFVFPNEPNAELNSINNEYIFENNIPMGANRWKDKLFITIPRRRLGVPSTLNYIPINSIEKHNVPLIPYPDLKTNAFLAPEDQEHLVSVYRVAVDPCDRLWMVDTGVVETLGNKTVIGRQRIVIIDLNADKIIKTYNFKKSDLTDASALALVTVDVTANTCDDAYAYFPDLAGYGLVIYSLKSDDSWRVKHNYFFLEPLGGDFNIGGIPFQWNDGVFSIALSDIRDDGFRDAIFHSMAGTHLYSVSTRILKDKPLATRSYHEHDFTILGNRGDGSQTSASDLHKPSGILFFALVNQNAVGCWNTNNPFNPENFGIVQKNDSTMIYPSDLKIYEDDLIVLTNTMPLFLYSSLNYDKTNFRVWISNVNDAVEDTVCKN